jgi:signal transduction histidine kinase
MGSSKRQKELLAAERLKATGRLASEVAHELNTPLGGILMYSHLLMEDVPGDDPRRENIVKINKLAHRCKIIVQGLLESDLDPALPRVAGDENKLEQVFINLVINAAQSMNGTGTLTLRTEFAVDTSRVRIKCSDTGCGVHEEHLSRIFEPFFTTKEKGKGIGLGLSICHGIVEQHGGTITVESSSGHGSTFTTFLPVAEEDIDLRK